MKQVTIIFMAFTCFIFLFYGCKAENSVEPVLGSVSGTVVFTNDLYGNNSPIAGITVYLINNDFVVDSVIYKNNKAAIVDSAVTDSSGKYKIANIKSGSFSVIPVINPENNRLYLATGSDANSFSVNSEKQNYNVNFSVYSTGNYDVSPITIRFINKNIPTLAGGWSSMIAVNRDKRMINIPLYESNTPDFYRVFDPSQGESPLDYTCSSGYSDMFYTYSNKFTFVFSETTLNSGFNYTPFNAWNYVINFGYSSCPSLAVFQVDWATRSITRIQ
ncbi:MAG: carboxypeptidase regulatory-like domain-containing protein [Ignavibacteriales bacterium]|nr:MAG: carboxypeptidase regulatory-like domain-containing protein [Ignavibacteriales bacterium]